MTKKHASLSSSVRSQLASNLIIDTMSLDDAASNQPQLYYQVSHAVANAESLRDQAKKDMEELEVELSSSVRRSLAKQGDKVTEKMISEKVHRSNEYQAAAQQYLLWKKSASHWQALQKAFEQRASMLKVMANLYSANYFSTDSLKGDPALKDAQDRSNRKLLDQQRRKRRARHGQVA